MIALMKLFKGNLKIGKIKIPTVAIISTLFFMYAHISNNIELFTITKFNPSQQLSCLINGLMFGLVYYETESLVPVIIMHNFFDVASSTLSYIVPFIYLHFL